MYIIQMERCCFCTRPLLLSSVGCRGELEEDQIRVDQSDSFAPAGCAVHPSAVSGATRSDLRMRGSGGGGGGGGGGGEVKEKWRKDDYLIKSSLTVGRKMKIAVEDTKTNPHTNLWH